MIVAHNASTTATRYMDDILLTRSWRVIVRKLEEMECSVIPYYVNRLVRMDGSYILEYARA